MPKTVTYKEILFCGLAEAIRVGGYTWLTWYLTKDQKLTSLAMILLLAMQNKDA